MTEWVLPAAPFPLRLAAFSSKATYLSPKGETGSVPTHKAYLEAHSSQSWSTNRVLPRKVINHLCYSRVIQERLWLAFSPEKAYRF